MKIMFGFLSFFFISSGCFCQAPNWIWAKGFGVGIGENYNGYAIAADAYGNVYVTGGFDSAHIEIGNTTLIDSGAASFNYNIFLAKYDPSGNVLWATRVGGTGSDYSDVITIDKVGNIYIGGQFKSPSITFGNAPPLVNPLPEYSGGFLVKYDPAGDVIWAKRIGEYAITGLSTDNNGNIYVGGSQSYSTLSKYDTSGALIWTKSPTYGYSSTITGVTTDTAGNPYITGLSFGVANSQTCYVAKFDTSGNSVWFQGITGTECATRGIVSDHHGHVVITGYFSITTVDDAIELTDTSLVSTGQRPESIFTVEFDVNGNIVWATAPVGTGLGDGVYGIASDDTGNIYITGLYISSTLAFDTITLSNPSYGGEDLGFIVKYNPYGTAVWGIMLGGPAVGDALATDAFGDLYAIGYYGYYVQLGAFTMPVVDGENVFVGKIGACTKVNPAIIPDYDTLFCYAPGNIQWYLNGSPISNDTSAWIITNSPGNYTVEVTSQIGCNYLSAAFPVVFDSVSYSETICAGEAFSFFGASESATGTYSHTLQNVNGGDSTIILLLTTLMADSTSFSATICSGDSLPFFGAYETSAGNYSHTLQNINGCDSVVVLMLSTYPVVDTTLINNSICRGATYPFFGTNETATGRYSHTLQSVTGCDSAVVLNLTVNPVPVDTISADRTLICPDDSVPLCSLYGFAAYQWSNGGTDSCMEATQAGYYCLTVTDNNGCTAVTDSIAIRVYPNGAGANVLVFVDTLVTYGAISYQWLRNGDTIPGATNPLYIVTQPGSYSVEMVDSNGCFSISGGFVFTGIAEPVEVGVSIYPNPSNSSWRLTVGNELLDSKLEVYNSEGRMIFKTELKTQNSELNLNIPSGVYFLNINNGKINVTKKLVRLY